MLPQFRPITPDGRTGFDQYGQLVTRTVMGTMTSTYHIRDVRSCTCYICGKGWENTTESLRDQAQLQGRDMHETCLNGHLKINAYQTIQQALMDAGFLFKMDEVSPRYPHSTPWQRISVFHADKDRTDSGFKIVLGRRKRVWELRVHRVGDLTDKLEGLPNNTMGVSEYSEDEPEFGQYFYVHAWSKEEMVSFLKVFHHAISERTNISIHRKDA